MSEFKCQEPGCEYHIGIGGELVTDEDYEQQEYYDNEIEEHVRSHDESVIKVRVRDLVPEHVGMQIELFGCWEDLLGFSHQGKSAYEKTKLHVGLMRAVPELLFLDATLDHSLKLRKRPAKTLTPIRTIPVVTRKSFSRRFWLMVSKLWR